MPSGFTYGLAVSLGAALSLTCTGVISEELHMAAKRGKLDEVARLISEGADVNSLDDGIASVEEEVPPLYLAAQGGHVEVARLLIENGADPELNARLGQIYSPGAPLHIAAGWGQTEVVRLFLDSGADPNLYDPWIGTPLHLALRTGRADTATLLLDRGARTEWQAEPIASMLKDASVEKGMKSAVYCGGCHSLHRDADPAGDQGPPLWDVVGRQIGSVEGFSYSQALTNREGVWDYEALNSFIQSPYLFTPGVQKRTMEIADIQYRADLISFLSTLSDNPAHLP